MPTLKARPPKYCRYRNGARVTIHGHTHYLPGAFNSDESLAEYRRLVAQWGAGMVVQPEAAESDGTAITVAEVFEGYRVYAEAYYGDVPRGRYRNLLPVIKSVGLLFADLPAHEFSPKKLKIARQTFVAAGYTRGHCNTCVQRVIAVFRWAVEEELVPGSVVHALEAVRPLQRGHTPAPEGKVVHAVPEATVDATLPHLGPVVQDMIRLQLVAGCRPGELCTMTPGQIDRRKDVWLYRPAQHKNLHHGHARVIALGPKAQDILRKYLLRAADAPCFSPREAFAQHLDEKHDRRATPAHQGNRPVAAKRKRRIAELGDHYTVASYRRAIERACDRAFPAPKETVGDALTKWKQSHRWTPHRLRHTAGTVVREQYGLDGAQAVLGHRNARVSEIYSELNVQKAVEIARQIG